MYDKDISTEVGTIIIIATALFVGAFLIRIIKNSQKPFIYEQKYTTSFDKENVTQEKITENQKMQEIILCKNTYNIDLVNINNINIAQKIAQITEKEKWICDNFSLHQYNNTIGITYKKENPKNNVYIIALFNKEDPEKAKDPFHQSTDIFRFDFDTNKIFFQDQFDGSFKFLSTLK